VFVLAVVYIGAVTTHRENHHGRRDVQFRRRPNSKAKCAQFSIPITGKVVSSTSMKLA